MAELPKKELLRPDEVADYLRVKRRTIYRWIEAGKIEAVKTNGLLRIPREAVNRVILPAMN